MNNICEKGKKFDNEERCNTQKSRRINKCYATQQLVFNVEFNIKMLIEAIKYLTQ